LHFYFLSCQSSKLCNTDKTKLWQIFGAVNTKGIADRYNYNLNHLSKINISLIDITGKQIGTIFNENQIPSDYQFDINAEKYHLSPGIYLMKFMMDNEVVTRRLVKF